MLFSVFISCIKNVTGDSHINRVLGMGMPKTWGWDGDAYIDFATLETLRKLG